MSVFVGKESCLQFHYKNNLTRYVKLAQDYNEGDEFLCALDLDDNNQFKKFSVDSIDNCCLLEEVIEYMPTWAVNALSDQPYGTVWSTSKTRPDNTSEFIRLMEKGPFNLIKPVPKIISNPSEPGVILKNGTQEVKMRISNSHNYGTGISSYVVTLDGIVYDCPASLAQAINSKLGL